MLLVLYFGHGVVTLVEITCLVRVVDIARARDEYIMRRSHAYKVGKQWLR